MNSAQKINTDALRAMTVGETIVAKWDSYAEVFTIQTLCNRLKRLEKRCFATKSDLNTDTITITRIA